MWEEIKQRSIASQNTASSPMRRSELRSETSLDEYRSLASRSGVTSEAAVVMSHWASDAVTSSIKSEKSAAGQQPLQQITAHRSWLDSIKNAGGWIGSTAGDGYHTVTGLAANAGKYVNRAETSLERGVDWYEKKSASVADWLANKTHGIPVAEQLANAGAWGVKQSIQMQGGILKGAGSLLGGVANMVIHPLDTLMGLEAMAEHSPGLSLFPGGPNPLKLARGLYDVGRGGKKLPDVINRTINPIQSTKDDLQFWKGVGGAMINPYEEEIKAGKYSEALGRGLLDIGSLVLTGGGGPAAEGAADAGRVASAAGKVGEAGEVTSVAGNTAEAVNAAGMAADARALVGKTNGALKSTETAPAAKAAKGSEVVEVPRELRQVSSGGKRHEVPLTAEQQAEATAYAERLGMPRDKIIHSDNMNTAWGSLFGDELLYIGTDTLPAAPAPGVSLPANSRVSMRGAMAHEVLGHREADIAGMTQLALEKEEAQASLRAAKFAPELTGKERMILFKDAMDRLKKLGLGVDDTGDLWLDKVKK